MKRFKRHFHLSILIFVVLAAILSRGFSSEATSRSVNSIQYQTIQEAINAAIPGATIVIPAGLYQESIVVNKTLRIFGEDKFTTILQANATDVIKVVASNVYISGFTIRNGNRSIQVNAPYSTITDNIIINNSIGIRLDRSSYSVVSNNTLINNTRAAIGSGIFLLNRSNNNLLVNNKILDSGEGIYILNSDNNTITGNWLINNSKTGICLMKGTQSSNYNVVRNNIIQGGATFGIDLWSVNLNKIINNTLMDNGLGLILSYSSNNTIYHNNLIANSKQVYSVGSQNVWDNGFEGNYWSDHDWADYDLYGILTKPYNVSLSNPVNKDIYPLRSRYMLGDANHDSVINTADAELLKFSWLSLQTEANYSPYVDFNQDSIINIKDATVIGLYWLKSQP